MIYDDDQFPNQQKKLEKVVKKQRLNNHFFLNKSLQVREYKQLNIVELSNQIDAFELEIKVTTESFVKQMSEKFIY